MDGLLGGPKGMLAPPLKLLGGGLAPPGPPSSYAYETYLLHDGNADHKNNNNSIFYALETHSIET